MNCIPDLSMNMMKKKRGGCSQASSLPISPRLKQVCKLKAATISSENNVLHRTSCAAAAHVQPPWGSVEWWESPFKNKASITRNTPIIINPCPLRMLGKSFWKIAGVRVCQTSCESKFESWGITKNASMLCLPCLLYPEMYTLAAPLWKATFNQKVCLG